MQIRWWREATNHPINCWVAGAVEGIVSREIIFSTLQTRWFAPWRHTARIKELNASVFVPMCANTRFLCIWCIPSSLIQERDSSGYPSLHSSNQRPLHHQRSRGQWIQQGFRTTQMTWPQGPHVWEMQRITGIEMTKKGTLQVCRWRPGSHAHSSSNNTPPLPSAKG